MADPGFLACLYPRALANFVGNRLCRAAEIAVDLEINEGVTALGGRHGASPTAEKISRQLRRPSLTVVKARRVRDRQFEVQADVENDASDTQLLAAGHHSQPMGGGAVIPQFVHQFLGV